jgi:hypothetical protein
MEKDKIIKDDYLGRLLQDLPMESLPDSFVDNVMEKIRKAPEVVPVRTRIFLFLRSSWSFALLSLVVIVFLFTSDLPFTDMIPGKGYFSNTLLPYFSGLFSTVTSSFRDMKNVSIPVMIIISGGILLLIDHWFSKRHKTQSLMFL